MRTSSTISSLFIALFFFSSPIFSPAFAQCDRVSDSLALVTFYYSMNGDDWDDNSNWLVEGQPIESWNGISVNEEGCVTEIYFSNNNLTGEIPSEIENLSSLERLTLYRGSFSGNIPTSLGNLSNLALLRLESDELTGNIPPELANLTNLYWLYIKANNLTGTIPSEIWNHTSLTHLTLHSDGLQGTIPPDVGNLINLGGFSIEGANITGSIPSEIGHLSSLSYLNIAHTQIMGPIPTEIGNLTNLGGLELDHNQLSGNIPSSIVNLTDLDYLHLNNNNLTGSIPTEINNITAYTINLSYNQLTGPIPAGLGGGDCLEYLSLNNNQLSGTLPSDFVNSCLRGLSLNDNQFTGSIPPELGNVFITSISLQNNQLTGSIPAELAILDEWATIQKLDFSNNQLTGIIPPELVNLRGLREFDISHNQITGTIPPGFGLRGRKINMSNNQLTGSIPTLLGDLLRLESLILNNNQLSGYLPREIASSPVLTVLSLANNQLEGCFPPEYNVFCAYPDIDFTGNPDLPNSGDFNAFCISGAGICVPLVGQIIFDENQNCSLDNTEVGLQNWMVRANYDGGSLYGISDENGFYSIYTYLGEYEVELIPPASSYWDESCTGTTTIIIDDLLSSDTLDFFPSALVDCPFMTADISAPFLRRCFDNTYTVSYCNQGTLTAENAYIEVQFDQLINVQSASIPISTQVDNTLVFELGDIAPNQCETFQIYIDVSCDAILDQTLCAIAHIYPDSICEDASPEWSGATVEIEGACNGDQVTFTIKNVGDGNMLENESYIVVEDGLILLSAPTPFILNSQEEFDISFPANGSTYLCRATQVDNHPFRSMPTAFVEGCGTNEGGGFSTGFVTQFPEDDNAPFVSIDCQETIGAFDPNDKRAYPKGYKWPRFIDKGQDIEYHIRFQNTGTDTAFTVVVQDIISPHLDITTFVRGSSSHPYSVDILGGDTLLFIFEDILLVDSFANEPASHGFVKFKMSQKEDVSLGTRIENTAGIFFDFNEAVITNTTWHTLGEDFIFNAINDPFISNLKVVLMPNPMIDQTCFQLSGIDFKNAELVLYSIIGVPQRRETFIGDQLWINKGNLPAGVYLFEVLVDGRKGLVGKLVVQ